MIKYIGSKRALAPEIERLARRLPIRSVADLFAGTTRAGQAFRRAGCRVVSNDLATYSEALGQAYVAAGRGLDRALLRELLGRLAGLAGRPGYVTRTFCTEARFFSSGNGARIDAIREGIDELDAPEPLRGCLLTSLLEAADRVDSTCGLQMAYLKRPGPAVAAARSSSASPPRSTARRDEVTRRDANALARDLDGVDCAYLDPPYNRPLLLRRTTTCGRPSCAGTGPRPTASRASAPTAAPIAATTTARGAPGTRWRTSSSRCRRPGSSRRSATRASTTRPTSPGCWPSAATSPSLAIDCPRYVGARIGIHNPAGRARRLRLARPQPGAPDRVRPRPGRRRERVRRARARPQRRRDASAMSSRPSWPSSSSTWASHAPPTSSIRMATRS